MPQKPAIIKLTLLAFGMSLLYADILIDNFVYVYNTLNINGHCFFIPVIAVFLIYLKRRTLSLTPDKLERWNIVLFVSGLILLLIGNFFSIFYLSQLSFLVTLGGLLSFVWGSTLLKAVAFPIGYLVFMFPISSKLYNQLSLPLQFLITQYSERLISLAKIPVFREGYILYLPHMKIAVVEDCSGIRSIMVITALATLLAYLYLKNNWVRLILVLLSFPIIIFSNLLRVSLTGVMATIISPEVAKGFLHNISGIFVFLVALLSIMLMIKAYTWLTRGTKRTD